LGYSYRIMGEMNSLTNLYGKSRWKGAVSKPKLIWKIILKRIVNKLKERKSCPFAPDSKMAMPFKQNA
jgi:hypothetical protein